MKRTILILIFSLCLVISTLSASIDELTTKSSDKPHTSFIKMLKFNQWLMDRGLNYRANCSEKVSGNTLFKKYCFDKDNKPVWKDKKNNLKVKKYKIWNIPWKENPDRDTLIYYLYKYQISHLNKQKGTYQWNKYRIRPSEEPYEFKKSLINYKTVDDQMQSKAVISYLYSEGDTIKVDKLSPQERFGEFLDNKSMFRSRSMGKSMVSYVLGHAICNGYIDGIDSKISDWPLVQNTLYEDQKLIDLLNMAAGDQKIANESSQTTKFVLSDHETKTIKDNMKLFKNKKKGFSKYNYNGLVTNIIFNYILFKSGHSEFKDLLDKTFREKAKIKDGVYFFRLKEPSIYGNASYTFYATRYDYLRIAKAIMNDYQNQTCVGKYLKDIYEHRINKGVTESNLGNNDYYTEPSFNFTFSYGGQFHMDYPGLRNKVVFGLGGHGGQAILIDMDDSRIVVLNAIFYNNRKYNYNVKDLLIHPIEKGIN